MNIDDLFVMEALEGLLIINPQNAEMIAVERENIKKAIDDIQFGRENSSLKDFYKQNEITLQSCVPITDTIPSDGGGVGGHPPYLPQKAMAARGC